MSRTEVVVDRVSPAVGDERFIEWLEGWLRARYVVDAYLRHNKTEVVFTMQKDMFRLFVEMYRVVEYMRWKLKSKASVAVCSDDGECIDMSDTDYVVFTSKYKIKKLVKAVNIIKKLVKDNYVSGVTVETWFGRTILNIGCYDVLLYTDEVVALSGILLDKLYNVTSLEILRDARDYVYSVFNPIDFNSTVVDLEVEEDDDAFISIRLDGCEKGFTYEEVLKLAYKLLVAAVNDLIDVKMIVERDYGIE